MNITIREKLLVEVLEFVAHKKGYQAGSEPGERAGDRDRARDRGLEDERRPGDRGLHRVEVCTELLASWGQRSEGRREGRSVWGTEVVFPRGSPVGREGEICLDLSE